MIHDFDRRYWFGASDAKHIYAHTETSTWRRWWDTKTGKCRNVFTGNIYTKAGNTFEHSILKSWCSSITMDRQILIPELRLRVNLDGNLPDTIVEVKTHQINRPFEITDGYYYQAQLQMLAWKLEPVMRFKDCEGCPKLKGKNLPLKRHIILSYGLYPDEYYTDYSKERIEDGTVPIDKSRIVVHEIKPSRSVQRKGKKSLQKLAKRLREEEMK